MRIIAPLRAFGWTLLVLLSLAFGTATVGSAMPDATTARLEAAALSGLLVADLCGDTGEGGHKHAARCSLCHLVAPAALAEMPVVASELRHVMRVVAPRIRRDAARPRDPATPTRGPPTA